jgi:hypothetical protein
MGIGAIAGSTSGHAGAGAVIGGVSGAVVGGVIGDAAQQRQAAARAACRDGKGVGGGVLHHLDHVLAVAWDDHALRHDLKDAGGRGIERAGDVVAEDVALHEPAKILFKAGHHVFLCRNHAPQ